MANINVSIHYNSSNTIIEDKNIYESLTSNYNRIKT